MQFAVQRIDFRFDRRGHRTGAIQHRSIVGGAGLRQAAVVLGGVVFRAGGVGGGAVVASVDADQRRRRARRNWRCPLAQPGSARSDLAPAGGFHLAPLVCPPWRGWQRIADMAGQPVFDLVVPAGGPILADFQHQHVAGVAVVLARFLLEHFTPDVGRDQIRR
ncbi:hypothetical protein G6F65_017363 [Rhizopus arrhizus]|nr:hypothetical protein G6F65_017363 [Rhizopus arrhizus]